MTYDIAVWEGKPPRTADEAGEILDDLLEEHDGSDEPPVPSISELLRRLLSRWPDIDELQGRSSPWAMSKLADEASGPLFYLGGVDDGDLDVFSDHQADPQALALLTEEVSIRHERAFGWALCCLGSAGDTGEHNAFSDRSNRHSAMAGALPKRALTCESPFRAPTWRAHASITECSRRGTDLGTRNRCPGLLLGLCEHSGTRRL